MKKVSRFAAQPKGTYGSVAPPSQRGGLPAGSGVFALPTPVAAAPSRPVRDYFDDEDDDVVDYSKPSVGTEDDDYDPLDDFMYDIYPKILFLF